jgi:hypothetical protein
MIKVKVVFSTQGEDIETIVANKEEARELLKGFDKSLVKGYSIIELTHEEYREYMLNKYGIRVI